MTLGRYFAPGRCTARPEIYPRTHIACWPLSERISCPENINTSFCYCCLVWEKFYEPETYKDIYDISPQHDVLRTSCWFIHDFNLTWNVQIAGYVCNKMVSIFRCKQASIFIGPNHSIQSIDNNVWTCWEIARTYYYSIQLLFFSYGRSWSFLSVANFKLLLIYKRYCLSAVLSMLSCVIVSKWLMPLLLPFTIGYSYCSLLLRDSCISAAYAVVRCPSVRLSVLCPSRSCIVSKRVNVFSNFSPTVEFYL